MFIKTVNIPIYNLDIIIIIDNWYEANKKFKLELDDKDYKSVSLVVESLEDHKEIFLLLKSNNLQYSCINHELVHCLSFICDFVGIKMEPNNDEPLAYLFDYFSSRVLDIVDKYKKTQSTIKPTDVRDN